LSNLYIKNNFYYGIHINLRSIKIIEGVDKAWIIHGGKNIRHMSNIHPSRQDGIFIQPKYIIRQESMNEIVLRLEENKEEEARPSLPSEEFVVNTINKYRKNLLDEEVLTVQSTSLKDYTTPEKIVEIVENL
jgi:hypothetical protein